MKVILLSELRGKGGEGDIVDVAQGYAENYLFPKRIAMAATPGNVKQLEERRHNIEKREEKRIADAEAAREALEGKTVKVAARVGEEGQLFGSVTSQMIADAVAEQLGVEIDRRRVERNASIKTAGTHEVSINLYREITANIYVVVGDVTVEEGDVPEAEESETEGLVELADIEAAEAAEAAEAEAAEAEETETAEANEEAPAEEAETPEEEAEEAAEDAAEDENPQDEATEGEEA